MEVSHTLRPATRHRSILLGYGDLLLSAVLLDETCSGFIIGGFFLSCALLFLFFPFRASFSSWTTAGSLRIRNLFSASTPGRCVAFFALVRGRRSSGSDSC